MPLRTKQHKRFVPKEAVQQFKIGRKRKADNALNQKRRNIFGDKTNCETASKGTYPNFYLAKTSFMLGTLDDIKRERLFSIAVILI